MTTSNEKLKLVQLYLLIGLTALLMRVIVGEVLQSVPHHGTLTRDYFMYAANLIDHGVYSRFKSSEPADSFRPPAYPLFLAGIRLFSGRDQWENWLAAIQYAMGSAACVLVAMIGHQVFSFRIGIVAGFIAAFYLDFIYITIPFLRETLSVFLLLAMLNSFLLYLRRKETPWLLFTALFFSVALLSRPEISLVGVLLALFFWKEIIKITPIKKAVIIAALALVPWSCWAARNYRLHHQFVPFSTEGAWAFFMGQVYHPDKAVPDGDIRAIEIISAAPNEMSWYRQMLDEGMRAIVQHPVRAIYWIGPKLRITFQEYAAHDTGLLIPILAVLIPWFGLRANKYRRAFTAAGALCAAGILIFGRWDRVVPIHLFHVSYTETVIMAFIGFLMMVRREKTPYWKVIAIPFLVLILANALTTSHLRQRVVLADWVLMLWAAYFICTLLNIVRNNASFQP